MFPSTRHHPRPRAVQSGAGRRQTSSGGQNLSTPTSSSVKPAASDHRSQLATIAVLSALRDSKAHPTDLLLSFLFTVTVSPQIALLGSFPTFRMTEETPAEAAPQTEEPMETAGDEDTKDADETKEADDTKDAKDAPEDEAAAGDDKSKAEDAVKTDEGDGDGKKEDDDLEKTDGSKKDKKDRKEKDSKRDRKDRDKDRDRRDRDRGRRRGSRSRSRSRDRRDTRRRSRSRDRRSRDRRDRDRDYRRRSRSRSRDRHRYVSTFKLKRKSHLFICPPQHDLVFPLLSTFFCPWRDSPFDMG